MIWKLENVVPNPFRDLQRFGYQEWRITKLMDRIGSNGFDENVVGRVRDGKLQLAFGHHRVEALRRLERTEADFIVKELSDDEMLRNLTQDNDTEFQHGLEVVFEAVSGAVVAFADGRIKPVTEKNTAHKYLRYAPYYHLAPNPIPPDGVPYTALSVAQAIGRTESDGHGGKRASSVVTAVLFALECLELGLVEYSFLFTEGDATKEFKPGCWFRRAGDMVTALQDAVSRSLKLREKTQKASADAAAHVFTVQQAINVVRKQEEEKEAELKADVRRLAELEVEANQDEWERKHAEYREKQAREKAAEPELRKKRRALNAKLKAAKEEYEAARKAEARAAAEARLTATGKPAPKQIYLPELTELIKHFEEPLPVCAAKVLKDKALLSAEHKKTLEQSIGKAIGNVTNYWKQLLSS